MELEMLMITGFIHSFSDNYDNATEIYTKALKHANNSEHEFYKSLSLCNVGIIEANKDYEEYLNNLN
jgi:hypothetical protein